MSMHCFTKFIVLISLFILPTIGFGQKIKTREIERVSKKTILIKTNIRIIIDKSDYFLRVYNEKELLARYPVVFGKEINKDKYKQGDGRTPEGNFKIKSIAAHKKWHLMMVLDYPTEESIKKFDSRKKNGLIKKDDLIGSAIGIHGTWPNEDFCIDQFKNWTDGCISMKNKHLDDLKNLVQIGTTVLIQQ
jgi:murein L,D-transpeptidase YafK